MACGKEGCVRLQQEQQQKECGPLFWSTERPLLLHRFKSARRGCYGFGAAVGEERQPAGTSRHSETVRFIYGV